MERTKTMKNYLEYDFSAIVGAEVEIELKDGSTYKGILVADIPEQTAFCVKHHLGIVKKMRNEDILSLSARIKGHDMSMKQIEKCAIAQVVEAAEKAGYEVCDACCCNGFVYYNTRVMTMKVFFLDKEKERFKGHTNEYCCSCASISLDGFYSCTEWGWKKS